MSDPETLAFATAMRLTSLVRSGVISAQAVVDVHLARIRALDKRIHAFVYVDEAAQANVSGELCGVTVGVKDTQPVRAMPWTCASPKWRERIAEKDTVHVARLRAAGAVVLGKTNTPEMAAGSATINELFPATNNPWRIGFTPGGSSGGSGAAVAAGLCTIAVGDDFAGSVRIPAASCGVVGFKPSGGRLPPSEADALPVNCAGPLTRSVGDARLILSVMIGCSPPSGRLSKCRIGVAVRSNVGTHVACEQACVDAAQRMVRMGHEPVAIDWDSREVVECLRVVRPVTLGVFSGEPEEYGIRVQAAIRQGRNTSAVQFLEALNRANIAARRVAQRLESDLDFVLTPTLGDPPCPIADVPTFGSVGWPRVAAFTIVANFAGLPAVSIPAGSYAGLPLGVQIMGRHGSDWEVLQLAEQLERFQEHRFRAPAVEGPQT